MPQIVHLQLDWRISTKDKRSVIKKVWSVQPMGPLTLSLIDSPQASTHVRLSIGRWIADRTTRQQEEIHIQRCQGPC